MNEGLWQRRLAGEGYLKEIAGRHARNDPPLNSVPYNMTLAEVDIAHELVNRDALESRDALLKELQEMLNRPADGATFKHAYYEEQEYSKSR